MWRNLPLASRVGAQEHIQVRDVDVFGYAVWRRDDVGIGQRIEDMALYRRAGTHALPFLLSGRCARLAANRSFSL